VSKALSGRHLAEFLTVVIGWPLYLLTYSLVAARNLLYNKNKLKTVRAPAPVVSVGNITFGGTGKTPLIVWLLERLTKRGLRVGYVSRGYSRSVKQDIYLAPGDLISLEQVGDEALEIHSRVPSVYMAIGDSKSDIVSGWSAAKSLDLILVDDGFQHRRLQRDIDIVLLDLSVPWSDYWLFPLGRSREPISSLNRAKYVIATKAETAHPDTAYQLESRGIINEKTPRAEYQVLFAEEQSSIMNKKVLLVSGIGNPTQFEQSVKNAQIKVVYHKIFKDHYRYGVDSGSEIKRLLRLHGADMAITTEKDWAKLKDFCSEDLPISVARVQLAFVPPNFAETLINDVCSLIEQNPVSR